MAKAKGLAAWAPKAGEPPFFGLDRNATIKHVRTPELDAWHAAVEAAERAELAEMATFDIASVMQAFYGRPK